MIGESHLLLLTGGYDSKLHVYSIARFLPDNVEKSDPDKLVY